jgi:hypothetical protein
MGAGEQIRQVVIRGPGQIEVTEVSARNPDRERCAYGPFW